jgi:hypothetical protein
VSARYYLPSKPAKGQKNSAKIQMSELQILAGVESGALLLTDPAYTDGFRFVYAYQIETVRAWLKSQVETFSFCDEDRLNQAKSSDAEEWYVLRGDVAAEVFGPLSHKRLAELKRARALEATDTLIAIQSRLRISACDFESRPTDTEHASPSEENPSFYLNRRSKRVKLSCIAILKNSENEFAARGVTLDISLRDITIYLKTPLTPGQTFHLRLEDSGAALDISTDAIVVSAILSGDGARCGLRFTKVDRDALSALRHYIKLKS